MAVIMYDLAGIEDRRFSPYCWRTRFALAHKGVDHVAEPVRFTDIDAIDSGKRRTLPTIKTESGLTSDSWEIAVALERDYPDAPTLFGGEGGVQSSQFIQNWANAALLGQIVTLVLLDIWKHLDEENQVYFRESREKRFGATLEAIQQGREERVSVLRQNLMPVRMTLRNKPWLGGESPSFNDYILAGGFQWARTVSDFQLLEDDDSIHDWLKRLDGLYNGLAASGARYW